MELYIFDRALDFKGIIEQYSSLRWIRRYNKCGEFELHCNLTSDTLKLLKKRNVVWKKDDLEAGYIIDRNFKLDTEGKEILVVRGNFFTGYLGQRIIWGIETLNTTAELGMRTLINNNAINPLNPDRKIDLLMFNEIKGYKQTISTQTSYTNLLEKVQNIADTSGLGIRTLIDNDNKNMIFDIYEGLDRTAGQTINPPAIFSKEFENVLEQEFTDSFNNYRNITLVAGEGEGTEREFITIGQGVGLDRHELFTDARDLQKEKEDGTPIPPEQYTDMLKDRGETKLSEHKEIQTFDSKVNLNSNLRYKEDFDLGDVVTCTSKKWGITIDTRITEIEEVYEEAKKQINVTFGDSVPTFIDIIKAVVK